MLTLHHADGRSSRRQFLTAGSLALGGLSLSSLFQARAASSGLSPLATGQSVIFLFQQGGPSQFETFDPKPEAGSEIRTVTGLTPTSIPGVQFGDVLPQLARLAEKLTIVRSYATGNGGHNIQPIVGPQSLNANLGTFYSRVVGATHPTTGMPSNAVLFPQAVDSTVTKGQGRGDLTATGTFGAAFAPFVPGGSGQLQLDLKLNLTSDRFADRRALLAGFDQLQRDLERRDELTSLDTAQRQACDVLLSRSVADALDLSREDPQVLANYDTSRFNTDLAKKANRGQRGYYSGHGRTIGKSLLLARRLCEAGCGFVTVHTGYEGVWDMHGDGNNLDIKDGMPTVGRPFDHAVAAFIADLEARGLSDKILLIASGEMGRTPRINKRGGRDHWAKLSPLMMYGGGVEPGVIGRSTRDGGEPASDPLGVENLISTILHTMFDMPQLRLEPALSQISKLGEAAPIGLPS